MSIKYHLKQLIQQIQTLPEGSDSHERKRIKLLKNKVEPININDMTEDKEEAMRFLYSIWIEEYQELVGNPLTKKVH